MHKTPFILTFIIVHLLINAQTTQDTIDNPYWRDMMFDRSVNFYQTKRAYDLFFSNKQKERGSGYKQFERWAENAKRELNEDGSFRPADFLIKELSLYKSKNLTPRGDKPRWTSLGPFNNPSPASMQRGVGRINIVAYHPTDPNTVYCGAPAGGFWYSKDKAQSWTKSNTDELPRFGVSAIAVIPEENSIPTILVGTGDRDANDAPGLGVYVSMDGGVNFYPSNTGMGNKTINRMVVNSMDNNIVLAAASDGIYKSYNKGQNWVKTTFNANFIDIVYHPTDTNFVYAAANGSFYRSTNGGNSWIAVSSGFSSTAKRRLAIAVTKAQPDIVYVISVFNTVSPGMEGFYKSSNKGASFTLQLSGNTFNPLGFNTNGSGTAGQGHYDLAIDASPSDSNVVYVGGINIFRSVNGGKNFSCKAFWSFHPTIPWVHADIHYMGRNPLNDELWIGSDGGIDYTANEKLTSTPASDPLFPTYNNRNQGLVVSQFYNLGVSQASLTKFITGSQDNGTSAGSSKDNWTAELGGDGMQCEISNVNTSLMFGSIQYGAINRTVDNGLNWRSIYNSITEYEGPWVTPYHIHPRMDNILVAIYRNVWVSRNASGTATPTFSRATTTVSVEGSALRFSNVNNNYVFCGWKDGVLRYSSNILSSNPSFSGLPTPPASGEIMDIETSYTDVNTLYVAKGNRIFKTTNLGAAWSNISGNLPNVAINTIALDKNTPEALYVGTDAGIYYKDSFMTDWELYSDGMSLNAPVRDIEIVYDETCSALSKVFAATYGRGLWLNTVQAPSNSTIELTSDNGNEVCLGEKLNISLSGGADFSYVANTGIIKNSANSFTLSPTESSQYIFYIQKGNNSCDAKVFNVIVNPLPKVTVTPNAKTINKGESVQLAASGADEYSWSPTTFIVGSDKSSSLNSKPENTITYTLSAKDSNNCVATTKVTITVNGTSSLHMNENSDMTIYPNPTSDLLYIKSTEKVNCRLLDVTGKELLSRKNEYFMSLPLQMLPVGTYLLELYDDLGNTQIRKISIAR